MRFAQLTYNDSLMIEHNTTAWWVPSSFLPPEMLKEKKVLSPATDVYAMCAVLAWCISGKSIPGAYNRVMGEKFDAREILPDHPGLADILNEGLALRPQDRIQDLTLLHKKLESL